MKFRLLSENYKYDHTKLTLKRRTDLIRQKRPVESYTYQRGAIITPNIVGKRCGVYNGYSFKSFLVSKEMVGFKFGAFVQTKKTGRQIHVKKKGKLKTNIKRNN